MFTNKDGSDFYEGTVFGKNNEILMTVKDDNGHFYSYWASAVTDPSATMSTYRLAEYKKDLSVLVENDEKLSRNDIKEVTLDTSKANSATIGLLRNGNTEAGAPVDGAITVTRGGGASGKDTFVSISNGKVTQELATGSKVEAIGTQEATTGIKINGQEYNIKSGSKVSVTQSVDKKTTTITVDDKATTIKDTDTHNALSSANLDGKKLTITGKDGDNVSVDLSSIDTDTKYAAGNGIAISDKNAISVKLKAGEGNLVVDQDGLALNNDILLSGDNDAMVDISGSKGTIWASGGVTAGSVAAGKVFMDGTTATVSGLSNKTTAYEGFATTGKAATEEQLKEVATEAGKHTTLVAGDNVQVKEEKTDNGLKYTVSATDTTYTEGNGIAINSENNAISVKLKAGEGNLVVDQDGLALNKDLQGIESVSNGAAKLELSSHPFFGATAKLTNGNASVELIGGSTKINGKVEVRQDGSIGGVTAGRFDNDAVNVSQLNKVSATAKTEVKAGTNIVSVDKTTGANGQDIYTVNAKDTTYAEGNGITISGENNAIAVNLKAGENNLEVTAAGLALKKDLNVDSVKAGEFYMSNAGIGYGDKAYITSSGMNANNQKITNVKAGEAETDAVNVSQLNNVKAEAGKHTTLVAGENVKLDKKETDKGLEYTVNAVDTKYTAGNGITIDAAANNAISVNLKEGEVNLAVDEKGLSLNKGLKGIESVSNGSAKLTLSSHPFFGTTAELTNGQASVSLMGGSTKINGKVEVRQDGSIGGVTDGRSDKDAVNVSQLNNVKAEAGKHTTLVAGDNVQVKEEKTDNGLKYTVSATDTTYTEGNGIAINGENNAISVKLKAGEGNLVVDKDGLALNKDLKGIESVSNGAAKLELSSNPIFGATAKLTNGKASIELRDSTTIINGKVQVRQDGSIGGVTDGRSDKDAVNVSQLKKVSDTANAGWNLSTNGVTTEATNVKPGETVDFSGDKNISVSHDGTKVKVKLNENIDVNSVQTNALNSKYNLSVGTMAENGIMPFFVNSTGDFYAAHNKFHVDKDGKVTATAGEIGNVVLQNGVYYGHSTLQDGSLLLTDDNGNHSYIDAKSAKLGKVTVTEDGKITGVAAGAITADSTDAVNGSQLHAVATEAGKHSKVVNGSNINVEEFDNDGQKIYKVNLNKDIMLGDLTGKYVNISGTNGTIETTGYIATQDRVYADKGAKLADIDVTGNKISNGASSIVLDGSNVKVNDKVTIDQNGKISGVAAGEVSNTSTDAINGSQLHQTNENVAANRADIDKNKADIAALDNRVTKNEQDIKQNAADIAQNKADIATNKADIATNKADIATNKANIAQNAADIKKVEELAKKHTTVTAGDNIIVTEDTNKDGGKEYNVALKNNIDLGDNGSVTTGQTVMNNDGLKVGKDVSVTATAVTAGKTSISDEGVKVGDKTYISDKGLNANDQKVTNVAAGELSETSKDAVNGSQLYKTNQEVVNNTNRINKLGSRVNKVGAGAAALAALHPMDFDPDDKLTFSAGYGNYAGENAAAIGAYYRPDEKVMFSVAGTVGNGENMVNAGVSFALDRTNHVSNSRTALAREVIDLRGQLAVMGAKMAKMEKAFGMLDETKTKLFPDVPANHWAYEYIAKLAGNGYIEGYPDGNFGGDRLMTRYEFAAMLYRAIENGAALEEKIIKEFEPELGRIRVDRISGEDGDRDKIERVRVNDTKGERDHYGNKLAK